MKKITFAIFFWGAIKYSFSTACSPCDIAKLINNQNCISIIIERSDDWVFEKLVNKEIVLTKDRYNLRTGNHAYYVYEVKTSSCNSARFLVLPVLAAELEESQGETNWTLAELSDDEFIKWLVFLKIEGNENYEDKIAYLFHVPDKICGIFQIKDDPLDNRLGVDLELLYEDLQLIISHRPDWASVSAGQLKTDFAKAVLERLLEQAAQPDQGNSEHSEVWRQAAE